MKHTSVLAFAALVSFSCAASAAPAPQAQGGSTQAGAQAGCMKQWMFDGVWRVRITNVAWHAPDATPPVNGWDVTMQWNNGTSYSPVSPVDTYKQSTVLALANGDTLTASDTTTGTLNEQQLDYHSFPASGQFTYTQHFISGQTLDQTNKPVKLLITFDVAKYKKNNPNNSGKFWRLKTPGYNYRIDLTCSK